MKKVTTILLLSATTLLISCGGGEEINAGEVSASVEESIADTSATASMSDEVKIGNQVWMSENLNVYKFRNGDSIPQAKTDEESRQSGRNGEPSWCFYNNKPDNGERYGKLYNWYAVNDPRGLAPKGWHIPDDDEWAVLTEYLGGENVAGDKMKSTTGWLEEGSGSNESGFSGLPGGYRGPSGGFGGGGGGWWSITEDKTDYAWLRALSDSGSSVKRLNYAMRNSFSVRCIRD